MIVLAIENFLEAEITASFGSQGEKDDNFDPSKMLAQPPIFVWRISTVVGE